MMSTRAVAAPTTSPTASTSHHRRLRGTTADWLTCGPIPSVVAGNLDADRIGSLGPPATGGSVRRGGCMTGSRPEDGCEPAIGGGYEAECGLECGFAVGGGYEAGCGLECGFAIGGGYEAG